MSYYASKGWGRSQSSIVFVGKDSTENLTSFPPLVPDAIVDTFANC